MEVALEPAPLLVAGRTRRAPRGDQVLARLRAGHGERDELAERPQAVLAGGWERVLAGDGDRAPQAARDDDRRGGRRSVAGAEDGVGHLPVSPPQSSTRAGASVLRTRAIAECAVGRQALADLEDVDASRLWRPTIVAAPSPS